MSWFQMCDPRTVIFPNTQGGVGSTEVCREVGSFVEFLGPGMVHLDQLGIVLGQGLNRLHWGRGEWREIGGSRVVHSSGGDFRYRIAS